ncbi:MAG: hypothetical protein P4L42_07565 [Desulfocapsaceae bacterium]|nr:hypothetical protein [Desulfocapsaceae bacterium]
MREIVESAANNVIAAVNQSVETIRRNRDRISDAADHMDGEFVAQLKVTQKEEIEEIGQIENELKAFYNKAIWLQEFAYIDRALLEQARKLDKKASELRAKEADIEKIIYARVADVKERIREESTSSRGLFKSALSKAPKVFDQNKITRFVYATISKFQEDFYKIQDITDVECVTRLFQDTIQSFQKTRTVMDRNGQYVTIIINVFSEDCYQDLFLFFYKYYNELTEIYNREKELPSTADEIVRVFQNKKKDAQDIIKEMHHVQITKRTEDRGPGD